MNLSHFSINHPVLTVMVTLLVILLGGIALWRLPIDLMPDISMARLSISTSYSNASPEEIEELITRPIEQAVSAVTGVENIDSESSEGNSRVSVTFTWGTNLDTASNDIRDRLDRIISRLPDDADRPTLRKFNPSDMPVLVLGVSSNLDPTVLRTLIDKQIKFRLERVSGVAATDIRGGNEKEIHINLDPDKLLSMNVTMDQILSSLKAGNINLPAGSIRKGNLEVRIRTPGTFANLDQIRNQVVSIVKGAPIRVSDVAEVKDTWREKTSYILINGAPGIQLMVYKQSGANTVQVAKSVFEEVASINRDFSQINIVPVINTSEYIERSISNLGMGTLYGGLLAIFVLLFFLRNLRSTAIVSVCIPISIVATFLLIYFFGFTLNIMTIGGLALGVGMLVDNAIVVMENILRIRNEGKSRRAAALIGSDEVTSAILASTLTTLVVFLPLIFMRGMIGVMFKQLAFVVSFSLFCSLVAAVSIVPMLASKLLRNSGNADEEGSGFMEDTYKSFLVFALRNRFLSLVVCFVILGASFFLVPYIGTELTPEVDENEVRVTGEMEVGTKVEVVLEKFGNIYNVLKQNIPEMTNSVAMIGGSPMRSSESNTGQLRISLVPSSKRKRSDSEIAAHMQKLLGNIPGMLIRIRKGQGLFILRMATRGMERLNILIRGHDFNIANDLAQQIEKVIEDIPGITDVRVSRTAGVPEELIVIDRRKAEELKLSVTKIGESLRTALAGSTAGEFREDGNEYRILVKLKDAKELLLDEILNLTVTNSAGIPIVLKNVVSTESKTGPSVIERQDQERIVDILVNISGRDMGSIVTDIREKLSTVALPRNFVIDFGGSYEEQQKAFNELMISFLLAVVLVYMVMASQFESLIDPFIVMFSLPFAAIGVILILFLTSTTLNMQSFIGCIMLAGIVVNNAILLVDYTNLLRDRDHMELFEAIAESGRRRLKPILMTAMTTSLALIPVALGLGEGGEAQAPMARTVIGGLLSSSFVTLLIIPVIYSFMSRKQRKQIEEEE